MQGYSLTQSAYLCFHLPTGRLYTSRHIKFLENQFPHASPLQTPEDEQNTSPPIPIQVTPSTLVQHTSMPSPSQNPHLQQLSTTSSSHSVQAIHTLSRQSRMTRLKKCIIHRTHHQVILSRLQQVTLKPLICYCRESKPIAFKPSKPRNTSTSAKPNSHKYSPNANSSKEPNH